MAPRALVLDACIFMTFGRDRCLELITRSSRRVVLGKRAHEEVEHRAAGTQLERAVETDVIDVESIDLDSVEEQEALAKYDALPAFRALGDSETLALAATRGYVVGSDDQAIRRQVREDLGPERIAGTLDLVVWAVRDGRLVIEDAMAFLESCDIGPALLRALDNNGISVEDLV